MEKQVAKFLGFTTGIDNRTMPININHITHIDDCSPGTTVYFVSGRSVRVNQTYEIVCEKLLCIV